MQLLTAAGLLVVVIFGSEAAPGNGGNSKNGYSADVSDPQLDDNKKCHKTITVTGPGIYDKLEEDCDFKSYVIANGDSLVVGERIYSDKPNQLVVVKDGKCELRTYKDRAYQSSSEMSSEDCDKVKKALSNAKSQEDLWSGQDGNWGGEDGNWGGDGGNGGGEGENWGGDGGNWEGEGGNGGGDGGNWGGEGGNWGGEGGNWGGNSGNWANQGGSGGWGYGYGSSDDNSNGGWGFGSRYGGSGNFGGNMVGGAQEHAQQMNKIMDGYREMFNNPGMHFARPPW